MKNNEVIEALHNASVLIKDAMMEEIEEVSASAIEQMVDHTAADISARYWLNQLLEPLSRKELKSIVDGFLVQLLNEEQAKKLAKFLIIRFPQYYQEDFLKPQGTQPATGKRVTAAAPSHYVGRSYAFEDEQTSEVKKFIIESVENKIFKATTDQGQKIEIPYKWMEKGLDAEIISEIPSVRSASASFETGLGEIEKYLKEKGWIVSSTKGPSKMDVMFSKDDKILRITADQSLLNGVTSWMFNMEGFVNDSGAFQSFEEMVKAIHECLKTSNT